MRLCKNLTDRRVGDFKVLALSTLSSSTGDKNAGVNL